MGYLMALIGFGVAALFAAVSGLSVHAVLTETRPWYENLMLAAGAAAGAWWAADAALAAGRITLGEIRR